MSRRKADEILERDGRTLGAQFNAYFGMTIVFWIFKRNHIVDWSWMAVCTPLIVGLIYAVIMLVSTTLRAYREEHRP
jgi:hypothetical protein